MENCIAEFCTEFDFPSEAKNALDAAYESVTLSASATETFEKYIGMYERGEEFSLYSALDDATAAAEAAGVHPYTASMLFSILLTPAYHDRLRKRGYSDEIYRDSMEDLRAKLFECYGVYNVWGSFVATWFVLFFNLVLFGLGRLEFKLTKFRGEYERNGHVIHDGDRVIDVHIPSKGRLTREDTLDAYRRAAAFFCDEFKGREYVFFCESWMLWPRHMEILPPESHIREFANDYDITASGTDEGGSDLWRIFADKYENDPSELPRDTSLRRIYADLLKSGEKPGWGEGVFFFDGEKIV